MSKTSAVDRNWTQHPLRLEYANFNDFVRAQEAMLNARVAKLLKAIRAQRDGLKECLDEVLPPESRQTRMVRKRREAGLCTRCGDEKLDPNSKNLGPKCLKERAAYIARRRAGQ